MSDVTADDADTEEALAEFNFLMPDGNGKALEAAGAGSQGRLLVYVKSLSQRAARNLRV